MFSTRKKQWYIASTGGRAVSPRCPSVRGWRPEFYLLPLRGEGEVRVCPRRWHRDHSSSLSLSWLPCSHELLFSLGFSGCLQVCDFLVKRTEEPYTDNKAARSFVKKPGKSTSQIHCQGSHWETWERTQEALSLLGLQLRGSGEGEAECPGWWHFSASLLCLTDKDTQALSTVMFSPIVNLVSYYEPPSMHMHKTANRGFSMKLPSYAHTPNSPDLIGPAPLVLGCLNRNEALAGGC